MAILNMTISELIEMYKLLYALLRETHAEDGKSHARQAENKTDIDLRQKCLASDRSLRSKVDSWALDEVERGSRSSMINPIEHQNIGTTLVLYPNHSSKRYSGRLTNNTVVSYRKSIDVQTRNQTYSYSIATVACKRNYWLVYVFQLAVSSLMLLYHSYAMQPIIGATRLMKSLLNKGKWRWR